MGTTLTGKFETRREAEMAVERLVQEHGLNRADIFVTAEGSENTAGEELSGSDTRAGEPTPQDRHDAPLHGRIIVSVDVEDDGKVAKVRAAFSEFHAEDIDRR